MNHNQKIGSWGEQIAAEYLAQKGYAILGKNIRTPYGEIDIIARVEDVIVCVEVKARTSHSFGLPEEGLTRRKLSHMRACANYYAAQNEIETWQCDAIAVEGKPGQAPHIEHFENVTNG
jgi:putative endonuclease